MGLPQDKIKSNIDRFENAAKSSVVGNEGPGFKNLSQEQKRIRNAQDTMKVSARENGMYTQDRGVKKVKGIKPTTTASTNFTQKKQEIYNRLSDSKKQQFREYKNNVKKNTTSSTPSPSPKPVNQLAPKVTTTPPKTTTIPKTGLSTVGKVGLGVGAAGLALGSYALYKHHKNKKKEQK